MGILSIVHGDDLHQNPGQLLRIREGLMIDLNVGHCCRCVGGSLTSWPPPHVATSSMHTRDDCRHALQGHTPLEELGGRENIDERAP
jgi:hypothetical protein